MITDGAEIDRAESQFAAEQGRLQQTGAMRLSFMVARTVQIGGETKEELLARLVRNGVQINEAGRVLFASDNFRTSKICAHLMTVELSVRDVGFPQGATMLEVYASAARLGLHLCPMELGPHLRLQFPDQPEGFLGQPVWKHRAPPGSIIIASEMLSEDDEFPKGFYLRRIKGVLWLRGYWSGCEQICHPEEHFVFGQL
ncbi:MAG: helicase [Candidatus Dormibacteraceae bacterium]